MNILVAGAGGAIGGAVAERLLREHHVRAVDLKPESAWWRALEGAQRQGGVDLRDPRACAAACEGMQQVYLFAADMGGMGYIETHKAACALNVLISSNMLLAARDSGVERLFFASSACVYPLARQTSALASPLAEHMAYPADPEDGYGWEKLFSERLCRHFREDFGLQTRIARYHNVYGPFASWSGGREKAPAAICRKVAQAVISGEHEIEIWGDGEQARSFLAIDDCVEGTLRLMASECAQPLNLGSSELVTINQLVTLIEAIAGVTLLRRYDRSKPQGVRGRSSDNGLCRKTLGWEPSIALRAGLEPTYRWVFSRAQETLAAGSPAARMLASTT